MFTLGENIKKLRREKDMTQETLASLLHISPQAVSRWETGVLKCYNIVVTGVANKV